MERSMDRRTFVYGASLISAAGLCGIQKRAISKEAQDSYTGDLPEKWDGEADVVVIGSGAAGAAASWFALDGGCSVCLLEELEDLGGSAIENAGQIAYGSTNVQKRLGYDTTPEQFKSWLQYVGTDGVPEELLDLYVNQGTEVIDWLESLGVSFEGDAKEDNPMTYMTDDDGIDYDALKDNAINTLGVEFHPKYVDGWQGSPEPICHMAHYTEMTDEIRHYREDSMSSYAIDCTCGGPAYMLPILDSVRDMGADIHNNTRAVKGYKDETGRVCGVMAEGPNGEVLNFKANKAVVIAGGLWMTDADLAKEYGGHIIDCGFVPFSVSDGGTAERIGLDMGGHIVNGDAYWLTSESSFYLFSFFPSRHSAISKGIIVDGYGSRFVAEDIYTPLSCYEIGTRRQIEPPDKQQFWVVLNDDAYQHHMNYLDHRVSDGLAGTYSIVTTGDNTSDDNGTGHPANESDPATMLHADTIEELAELMDAPYLPTQIEIYNKMVEQGEDTQCGRFSENLDSYTPDRGPFHAGQIKKGYLGGYTSGGLDINVHGQVLDDAGQPIPGLYAAGRSARSICEGVHHPSTGMSCAQGMLMGRIIGKYIAAGEPQD